MTTNITTTSFPKRSVASLQNKYIFFTIYPIITTLMKKLLISRLCVFRCICWRKASRQRTSLSQNARLSLPRSLVYSQGKWLSGFKTAVLVGKQNSSRETTIFSSPLTTNSSLTTTPSSRTTISSDPRYLNSDNH